MQTGPYAHCHPMPMLDPAMAALNTVHTGSHSGLAHWTQNIDTVRDNTEPILTHSLRTSMTDWLGWSFKEYLKLVRV